MVGFEFEVHGHGRGSGVRKFRIVQVAFGR